MCVLNVVCVELECWCMVVQYDFVVVELLDELCIVVVVVCMLVVQSVGVVCIVFNLIGIVLYMNFGCVLLFDDVVCVVVDVFMWFVNFEFDFVIGCCGDCDDLIDDLLCELMGVEVVIVVNNNVVVVLLMLLVFVMKWEVVVLCGELVEIGGVFWIFDIMSCVGVKLYEVGMINCMYLYDYVVVIGLCMVLLMKVYCSNYVISGFMKEMMFVEFVLFVCECGVLVVVDFGSGMFVDLL